MCAPVERSRRAQPRATQYPSASLKAQLAALTSQLPPSPLSQSHPQLNHSTHNLFNLSSITPSLQTKRCKESHLRLGHRTQIDTCVCPPSTTHRVCVQNSVLSNGARKSESRAVCWACKGPFASP